MTIIAKVLVAFWYAINREQLVSKKLSLAGEKTPICYDMKELRFVYMKHLGLRVQLKISFLVANGLTVGGSCEHEQYDL